MTVPTVSISAAASISRSPVPSGSSRAARASTAAATGCASAPSSSASTACAATSRACRSPNAPISSGPDVPVLVNSSDVHVDDNRGTAGLKAVLATARALRPDVVLLAGDTFESHQLSAAALDRAARLLASAKMPIVILPGNHDPALPDSVFVRSGIAAIPDVRVLGVTHEEAVQFP